MVSIHRFTYASGTVIVPSAFPQRINIPFSQRCLLRLPSFPFCKASRLLRLSRRSGSRRLNDTDGTCCISLGAPDRVMNLTRCVDRSSCDAGMGSSRGIVNGSDAPRKADRERDALSYSSRIGTDTESEMVRSSNEAVVCSVQAEMARVCCGDRLPWRWTWECSSGWMAIAMG